MYRSTFSRPLQYLEVNGKASLPATLLPVKMPLYPLARRLGGPQNSSALRRGEKMMPLPGLELLPFGPPASQPIVIPTGPLQCSTWKVSCVGNDFQPSTAE
jgi:hypothetical protein